MSNRGSAPARTTEDRPPIATLKISTEIPNDTKYYDSGFELEREGLEIRIRDELSPRLDNTWALWQALNLPQVHPLEDEVYQVINDALTLFSNGSEELRLTPTIYPVPRGPSAVTSKPRTVRYIWHHGKRIRLHTYALDIKKEPYFDFEPWIVEHFSDGVIVSVTLCAELSWELSY